MNVVRIQFKSAADAEKIGNSIAENMHTAVTVRGTWITLRLGHLVSFLTEYADRLGMWSDGGYVQKISIVVANDAKGDD
jgi:hypothetical protein